MRKNLNAVVLLNRKSSDVVGILTPEAAKHLEELLGPDAPYFTYSVNSGDPDFFIGLASEGCENMAILSRQQAKAFRCRLRGY